MNNEALRGSHVFRLFTMILLICINQFGIVENVHSSSAMRWVILPYAVSFLLTVSYCLLSPKFHHAVEFHFQTNRGSINMYFCSYNDAVENLKATHNMMAARKVLGGFRPIPTVQPSPQRALVFLDATCVAGMRLLEKNSQLMALNYRWLIYVEDVESVVNVLNTSRIEMDSDVTLIRPLQEDFEFLRLARLYLELPLELPANYSLEDASSNHKLSQAFAWRDDKVDLGGYAFKAITVFLSTEHTKLEEWGLLVNKSIQSGVANVRRYFTHLTLYAMQMCNFTLNLTVSNEWGFRQPNGSYSGAFGIVANREKEFCFSTARLDSDRVNVLDFTFPVMGSKFVFVVIQPKTFGTSKALFVPFRTSTWVAFFGLVLIFVLVMRLTVLSDRRQLHNDSWGGSFLLVLGAVSQNGIPDDATRLSSRAIYLITLVSSFIIFSYYSVAVLKGLILPAPDPIQNMEQLLASDYRFGGVDVSYIHREFMLNNDSLTVRARRKLGQDGFLNMAEGLSRVRKGRFAFYGLSTTIRTQMQTQYTEDEKCRITELQMVREFPLSFFLRKYSPFTEILNRALIKMKERGIIDYLQSYWLEQKSKCAKAMSSFTPIKLQGLTLAYGVLAVGIVFSLNAIIWEWIAFKIRKSRMEARVILQVPLYE